MPHTVLITGCSSGFGHATARLFSSNGWNVAATMRNAEDATELSKLDNVLITRLDVQDRHSIASAVEATLGRFGHIDVLVNNAGFGLWGVFESTPRQKILEQFEVNVFGVMDVTRAVLPHFRAKGSGVIVNISSGAGVFTLPLISLYCASKFALEGFSESLAFELAPLGILVKIVEPGGVLSTGFSKRSEGEASAINHLADYGPLLEVASANLEKMIANLVASSADDVANVIFKASTDGRDQIRYLGTTDIKPLIAARRESSEVDYITLIRSQFSLTGK